MQQLQEVWKQLEGTVTNGQNVSALTLCAYLILGGILRCTVGSCSATAVLRRRTVMRSHGSFRC